MSAIEAIQSIFRVFQLFSLSVVSILPNTSKISIGILFKIYSLLHIGIRVTIFLYASISNQFFIRNNEYKIVSAIDTVLICGIRLVEIAILVEAFVKRKKEKQFMDDLVEIDKIIRSHFNIDMKYDDLKRSTCILSIIWLCTFLFGQGFILYLAHESSAYFYFCLTYLPPFFISSISYFQIITCTKLIRYRFLVLNRLIKDMDCDQHYEDANWKPIKGVKNMFIREISGKLHESFDPLYETHLFDRFIIIRNLYYRLWNQTEVINERFRCSMVFNIGNDFVSLLSNFYWMFMCMLGSEISINISVVGCLLWSLINIFHILMLSNTCHNTAVQASQIAHVTHCIKHVTLNSKLSAFVRIKKKIIILIFLKINENTSYVSHSDPTFFTTNASSKSSFQCIWIL